MTIAEWLKSKQSSTKEKFSEIIKDVPDDETPTKEELVKIALELASDASIIYNKGFKDALELIEKCDSKFLSRKVPPHIATLESTDTKQTMN